MSCIRNLRELVEMPLSKPSYWIHSGYVPSCCASLRPSALRSLILQYISRPRALFLSSTWSLNLGFLPLHCTPALRNVQILHIRERAIFVWRCDQQVCVTTFCLDQNGHLGAPTRWTLLIPFPVDMMHRGPAPRRKSSIVIQCLQSHPHAIHAILETQCPRSVLP